MVQALARAPGMHLIIVDSDAGRGSGSKIVSQARKQRAGHAQAVSLYSSLMRKLKGSHENCHRPEPIPNHPLTQATLAPTWEH